MVRDGRDIIDSQLDARKTDGWMVTRGLSPIKENERKIFIKYQSERFTHLAENILETIQKHSKKKVHLIKYEDLLNNTFENLKILYDFISIPLTDHEIKEIIEKFSFENIPNAEKGSGKFFRIANPGNWKITFSENEKKEMEKIMENVLVKLGYTLE